MACSGTFNGQEERGHAAFWWGERTLIATVSALVLMWTEDAVVFMLTGDSDRRDHLQCQHLGERGKNAAHALNYEEREVYRSLGPIAHYVAADRPDIQYTIGVLMRYLEEPTVMQRLQL